MPVSVPLNSPPEPIAVPNLTLQLLAFSLVIALLPNYMDLFVIIPLITIWLFFPVILIFIYISYNNYTRNRI